MSGPLFAVVKGKITGLISPGTGVSFTGSGTAADPYVVNAAGGGGSPGGTTGQVQYNNAGSFAGVAGSAVGSGFSAGSVAFSRLSAGTATPLSILGNYYFFVDGGAVMQDHGLSSWKYLDCFNGTYIFGNTTGQQTSGYMYFDGSISSFYGGTGDQRMYNAQGGNIQMSSSDGSVYISNDSAGNFIIVDAGGGVTMRAAGDQGGMYADPSGNTFLGWYSAALHMTIGSGGEVTWGANSFASNVLTVGADYGTGGYWVFNAQNYGSQAFFDIISGNNGASCSIRVFTDVQCGEFAGVGGSGEYFGNTIAGDCALKGDPGGGNFFRIGVGSSDAQFNVGSTDITLLGVKLTTQASTTSRASMNVPSGTAPSSPVSGDIWFDGTNFKARVGGTTKTFTLI